MRFGLRCIVALAILYRAILVSQGWGSAGIVSSLAETAPAARMRDAIAARVDGWCRSDPAACLANASRLTSLVAAGASQPAAAQRHGAMSAAAR